MTVTRMLGAVLVLSGLAGSAVAQSFDCGGALKPDEKAVCDSGRLSALDDEMAALYRDVMARALMGVRGATHDEQQEFLAARAACGADEACIAPLYETRIADLRRTREGLPPRD